MTARNEIRMAGFFVGGAVFFVRGLFAKAIHIRGIEMKPYQRLLFRLLLIAIGINGILIAFDMYNRS